MSAVGNTLQGFWNDQPVMTLLTGIGVPLQAFLFMGMRLHWFALMAEDVLVINTFAAAFIGWITQRNVNSPSSTANAINLALNTTPSHTAAADVATQTDVKIPTEMK